MTVVWFLDVDGVVNAFGTKPTRDEVWPDHSWMEQRVNGYRICVSEKVRSFLRSSERRLNTTIWWHTTWQDDAQKISRAFGLPYFSICYAPEFTEWNIRDAQAWWKAPAVKRALDEGYRVVWTDDDIEFYANTDHTVRKLLEHENLLAICPNGLHGLTEEDLGKIDEFLSRPEPRLPRRSTARNETISGTGVQWIVDEVSPRYSTILPTQVGTTTRGTSSYNFVFNSDDYMVVERPSRITGPGPSLTVEERAHQIQEAMARGTFAFPELDQAVVEILSEGAGRPVDQDDPALNRAAPAPEVPEDDLPF